MEVTIATMVARWSSSERPLFKGKLIDEDGCKCAQGDVLSCAGYTDKQLRRYADGKDGGQASADAETARVLGISRIHAVLLRQVNDAVGGAPQLVLTNPEQILGDKASLLLAFWKYLDGFEAEVALNYHVRALALAALAATAAAGNAELIVSAAAQSAAGLDAHSNAGFIVSVAAQSAAGLAAHSNAGLAANVDCVFAAGASFEIQGMDKLESDGRQPYYLAIYGFDTWDKVRALAV